VVRKGLVQYVDEDIHLGRELSSHQRDQVEEWMYSGNQRIDVQLMIALESWPNFEFNLLKLIKK